MSLPRGSRSVGDVHVSGTREPPAPLDLSVDALMREMVTCLVDWDTVCHDPPYPSGPVRPAVALAAASRALRRDLGGLLTQPAAAHARRGRVIDLDGRDAGREVLRLHHRARLLLRLVKHVEECPAPCPACDTYGLTRESGSDSVWCETCNRLMSYEEYLRWVETLLNDTAT